MAESQLAVASAVILPDPVEDVPSPLSTKRRQSSITEQSSKRPRLGQNSNDNGHDVGTESSTRHDQPSDRQRSGQLEERKRGQRLFGALLGTLSQSSSSAAQKRRTDIEKKQQAKLKLQAEEYDEKKKQQLQALMEIRRREQKKFDKQSMQIRHSNLLAQAQFLQTRAEPIIYYMPWELLPGDNARIKSQIEKAEKTIEEEAAQFEEENPETEDNFLDANAGHSDAKDDAAAPSETVGLANDLQEPSTSTHANTNTNPNPASDAPSKLVQPDDVSKDHGDDGGEIVLEGEEDTVIY